VQAVLTERAGLCEISRAGHSGLPRLAVPLPRLAVLLTVFLALEANLGPIVEDGALLRGWS
jgi:hypothetical protein